MGKINKKLAKKIKTTHSKPQEIEPKSSEENFLLELSNLPSDVIENKFDDTKSVKSMKSIKNELGIKKISKKDKIKLRQKVFLKKITSSSEFKRKVRNQAKGNPKGKKTFKLNDELPELGLDLAKIDVKVSEKKSKPIAKASKRKKQEVKNVNLYKAIISDKNLINNPFGSVMHVIKQKFNKGTI